MLKIDVCLEAVFTSLPYAERIERIAQCGFKAVEFWFHDATFMEGRGCAVDSPKDTGTLRQVCRQHGVKINNMVVNAPDGSFGGAPVRAEDRGKYLERLDEVIEFARGIGCDKAITCSGNCQAGFARNQMRANLEKALAAAAEKAEASGFTLLLEPLNTRVDHAGYFLDSSSEAAEIVRAINSPCLKLLYDVYHMQIMEGDIIASIRKHAALIGHFHSAGVPGRHELMEGELNYAEILKAIKACGYKGAFGLEYFPAMKDHATSLKATRKYIEKSIG